MTPTDRSSPVELALTPDGRWEIDTQGLLDAARAAGFTMTGLSAQQAVPEVRSMLSRAGLTCHEVLALILSDDETETLDSAERLAAAAAAVGASWVLTVFRSPIDSRTAPIIRRCASMFAEAGAGLAAEFSPLGPVSSIEAGLEVVEAAGEGQAGLMIDSWHFCHSQSTWGELGSLRPEQIAYVQFTDGLAPESENMMRETLNRRVFPGDGILPLERFAGTLLDRGWRGIVSVEVLNRDLRQLPVAEFAQRAFASTAPFWR